MRYTKLIGSQDDYVERHSIKPKYAPCPHCGKKGKRKRILTRRVRHVAALHRRSWIEAEVGVYQARCTCCKGVLKFNFPFSDKSPIDVG